MRSLLPVVLLLCGCPTAAEDTAPPGDTAVTCEDVHGVAADLVVAAQACTAEVGCEVVDLYTLAGDNNCLAAFQCSAAFPAGADLTALASEAVTLSERARTCGDCRDDVSCIDPAELTATCNEATGLCEIVE